MKKLLALFLSILMVFTILPPYVLAADTNTNTTTIMAGSDFQAYVANSSGGYDEAASLVAGANSMKAIMNQIKAKHPDVNGILFGGDYTQKGMDAAASKSGFNTIVNAVREVFPSYSNRDFAKAFITGNHDCYTNIGTLPTGYYDCGAFGVYALNYEEYQSGNYGPTHNKDDAYLKSVLEATGNAASALNTALSKLSATEKPVFVMSHLPLHYSYRTTAAKDALYADKLVYVLNKHAARGLNIIFLFGHNHSAAYDNYLGGSTNYVAKGENIWVADSTNLGYDAYKYAPIKRTINFTYMNYGYVAHYNAGNDTALTMSVFEINGNDVTIRRYSKDGEHPLQANQGQFWSPFNDQHFGYDLDTNADRSGTVVYGNDFETTISGIELNPLNLHTSITNAAVKNPVSGHTYTWTTNNSNIARVTTTNSGKNAVISGVNEGTACITVNDNTTGGKAMVYVRVAKQVHYSGSYYYKKADALVEQRTYIFTTNKKEGDSQLLGDVTAGGALEVPTTFVSQYNGSDPHVLNTDQNPINAEGYQEWIYRHVHYNSADSSMYAELLTANTSGTKRRLVLEPNANTSTTWGTLDKKAESDISAWESGKTEEVKAAERHKRMWKYSPTTGLQSLYTRTVTLNGKKYTNEPYVARYYKPNGSWESGSSCTTADTNNYSRLHAYEKAPLTYTYSLSDNQGVLTNGKTGTMVMKTWSNGQIEYFPVTTDMLSVNTTKDGTYTNVQVVFNNSLICDNYTVQVGTAKTIPVAEGYYYRLTDEFVPSEGLQYKNNNTYLILDRNAQGNGVMMISQGICDKNVIPADVTVALDADGVPCVRSESMLTSTKLRFQEWMYHYHSDGTFYLMQPNLGDANVGYNNNLRVAAPGGAILVTGSPDAYSIKNPVMSSSDNYTTTSGNVNVAGASMYLQYNSAAKQFQGVLAANRKQGSEIYIYEKVTYNTASASVVGLNGKVSKGSAATAKTGTEISITYPDGRQELVPVTANMLYKNGKALTATDLKNNTTLTGLTLKYQGITLASNYVLTI